MELMHSKLQLAFEPTHLEIIDESHLHRAHAAAKTHGGGHFKLIIRAKSLGQLPRIQQHQCIYQALAELMQSEIHALSIHIKPEARN